MNTKLFFLLSLVSTSFTTSAFAVSGLDPKSNVTTAYEFWMGTNADCSNLVKVIDLGANGKQVDTEQGVDIGAGTLPPAGTYQCLAIVVSDTTIVEPATSGGNCQVGHKYAQKTFRGGNTSALPSDPNTVIHPTSPQDGSNPQKVAAYFSTSGNMSNDGHSPASAQILSGGAVVVGADSISKTFFVDCKGKVQDGQSGTIDVGSGAAADCATNACNVGFR